MSSRPSKDAGLEHRLPWLGRARFRRPQPATPQRFVADTREEQLWRRCLPGVFAPGKRVSWPVRLLNHIVVVPLAHITLFNLEYQVYLNQILHTSAGAWLGHAVLIPLNVSLLFYALAFHTGAGVGFDPLALNASMALLAVLAAWYLGMAIKLRSLPWAAITLPAVALLWMAGNGCAGLVCGLEDGAPWYLRPLPLIAAVSVLQAYSHLFEDHVPPRANFVERWLPVREFIWGDPEQVPLARRLLRLAWLPVGGLWGTLDEWWASAKLMPIYILDVMWAAGYRPAQREHFRSLALDALASGDPALDWVGVGGGASVAALGEFCADDACDAGWTYTGPSSLVTPAR
jgi:hypothetical protein